jgi:hypothetical protein
MHINCYKIKERPIYCIINKKKIFIIKIKNDNMWKTYYNMSKNCIIKLLIEPVLDRIDNIETYKSIIKEFICFNTKIIYNSNLNKIKLYNYFVLWYKIKEYNIKYINLQYLSNEMDKKYNNYKIQKCWNNVSLLNTIIDKDDISII